MICCVGPALLGRTCEERFPTFVHIVEEYQHSKSASVHVIQVQVVLLALQVARDLREIVGECVWGYHLLHRQCQFSIALHRPAHSLPSLVQFQ